ncbi:hypothetical protein PPL_11995 [Heterostelium album PN500]|uniref:DUF155 domain-containing protein n=1 Tax=Heterostelium pallidum (strain ATCC 26659 / Pp 5 / PN500) TaxID=670386 RepID=D3BV23_HETP5|nr:hypothetical protein PPL_11995 [Heterostelium album PN500]EFA74961.1 hypothetical protein PPL_11995 [Heterostelium album PN500]|eukprot:XP_020427095.1 hypothetical protein PPL_11995 [Heterostelium album PN500]
MIRSTTSKLLLFNGSSRSFIRSPSPLSSTTTTSLFLNRYNNNNSINNTHISSIANIRSFSSRDRQDRERERERERDRDNRSDREIQKEKQRDRLDREKQQRYNNNNNNGHSSNNNINIMLSWKVKSINVQHSAWQRLSERKLVSLPDDFSLEKVFSTSNVKWLRYNPNNSDTADSSNEQNQTASTSTSTPLSGSDVFIFPSFGCVVSWGVPEHAQRRLLAWLQEYKVDAHPDQLDIYRYTDSGNRFEITKNQDLVTLSTDPEANFNEKFAVSYAFAQSVRLFLIEDDVMKLSEKVASLPDQLSRNGTVQISKKEIVMQLGEQMKIKNYLNLHSDIIDTPEHFWEHTEGEGIYKTVRSHCEIDKRVRIMNERLNLISGIYDVINDEQKHSHSIRLERIIIALIAVEGTSSILHWFF